MKSEISAEFQQKIDDKVAFIRNELVAIAVELEAKTNSEYVKVITSVANHAVRDAVLVLAMQEGFSEREDKNE